MRAAAHQNVIASAIRILSAESNPACLLDAQGTFMFVNEAWDRVAESCGGGPRCMGAALIGTAWLDHIHGPDVRERHATFLHRALRPRPGLRARGFVQVGEANTPTTAALLSTRYEPVLAPGGEPVAVSIVHTIVRERPIEEVYDVDPSPADAFRDVRGDLTQCACCRRVRDPRDPERWVIVAALLAAPVPTNQVVCELCGELHYGGIDHI